MNTQAETPGRALHSEEGQIAAMEASVHAHGFGVLEQGLAPDRLARLQAEAEAALDLAVQAESTSGLRYRARIGSLGPEALSLLRGAEMSDLLKRVFGGQFALSDQISCYTHYGARDHLGAHQDQPATACEVTIILYLRANSPAPSAPDTGLVLRVYGETHETVGDTRLAIPTRAGSVVLGRGSRYWHERPSLKAGEDVIAITGCYRPAD